MSGLSSFARVSPFLWFNANAAEAAAFYVSVFPNSRLLTAVPAGDAKVLVVSFELDGVKFSAINGGPAFHFTEAVSFVVRCDSQAEIDHYWTALSAGGSEGQCGWLKDRFGLSWQVVPARLPELIRHPKAMQAMLKMKKLDIGELERAAET